MLMNYPLNFPFVVKFLKMISSHPENPRVNARLFATHRFAACSCSSFEARYKVKPLAQRSGSFHTSDVCVCFSDVDECAAGVCKGNKCTNVPGGYRCECETGYRFHGDACAGSRNEIFSERKKRSSLNRVLNRALFLCTDVDECTEKTPCSERCVNTPGSYYCTCLPGFRLQGDECVGKLQHSLHTSQNLSYKYCI